MSRWNGTGPSGVPFTCDAIDDVIRIIEDYMLDQFDAKSKCIDIMETIRRHNQDLREFGNEEHKRANGLEADVEELESQNKDLQYELDDASAKIEELRNQLEVAEEEAYQYRMQAERWVNV